MPGSRHITVGSMIDLSVSQSMMEALHRFLRAADDGATLRKIEREGETILYFRKNGRPWPAAPTIRYSDWSNPTRAGLTTMGRKKTAT